MTDFIKHLESIIKDRKDNPQDSSYTSKLFQGGIDRIAKKIGEEAGEVIIAAKNQDKTELANESADLLFHLLMLLQAEGLTLDDVISVLKTRHNK